MDLSTLDFFDNASYARERFANVDYLSENKPVWHEPQHGVVVVTGYEEAIAVLRDPATFSSATLVAGPDALDYFPVKPEGDDVTEFVNANREYLPQNDQIVTADPPVHTAQRALLMGLITPKRLKENEEFIWRITDRMLDEVLALGGCEFVSAFVQPYTRLIIADLMGVPEEDHEALLARRDSSDEQLANLGGRQVEQDEQGRGHNTLEVFYDYFSQRIAERRGEPKNDVLTGMAQATFPDGTLPEPIVLARIAANMFSAGQETTVRLIAATMRRIGDEPELQARLRAEPDLIPRFIEETLRFEGPVRGEFRIALKTTTLGGVEIPAGTQIMLVNGGANRDPRQFECPAEFRSDRENARRHLGFGHGVHTCPGAPLARAETRVTLERILDRTTDIRISQAHHGPAGARRYDYMPSVMFNALTSLHLEFTVKG